MVRGSTSGMVSRRRTFIKTLGTAVAAASSRPFTLNAEVRKNRQALRILRWRHFIPEMESWFNDEFVPNWSARNDIDVVLTNVGLSQINDRVSAEAIAGQGHDMVELVEVRPDLEDQFIDHSELFEECRLRFGSTTDLAYRSTFNPRTQKYFGLCTHYSPPILTYRQDLWGAVGLIPTDWDTVRKGGRAIKLLHDTTQGVSLSSGHNGEHGLRAMMSAFGSFVQDADAQVSLDSVNTLNVLNYIKALYDESMPPEVLSWTPPSNNRYMLSGQGALTIDTLSIMRGAESSRLPVERHLRLNTLPDGPFGKIAPAYGSYNWSIWRFSRKPQEAMQFIADYVSESRVIFLKSGFQEMPTFPDTVPDFSELIVQDRAPGQRYKALEETPSITANFGYPGFANAAVAEVRNLHIIPEMVRRVVTGELSAQIAMEQAHRATEGIFEKWRLAGKL